MAPAKIKALLRWAATHAREHNADRNWANIALVLLDDEGIRAVNREYLQRDHPTDVISFTYDPVPGDEGLSGEILVNVERAVAEGTRRGSVSRELALYVLHGALHLAGEDDEVDDQRARMEALQEEWLEQAVATGLAEGLIPSVEAAP